MDNDEIVQVPETSQVLARSGRFVSAPDLGDLDYETVDNNRPVVKVKLAVMTAVTHFSIVAFTVYIIYLSFQTNTLFSWHPTCMTIGFFLLMSEAIMAVSPDNHIGVSLKRQGRIRLHFVLQAAAAAFIFAGFVVIYVNKNVHNKSHFHTWHGILGLVSVIMVVASSSGGLSALYAVKFKHKVKPAVIKLAHNVIGVLTFIFGVITLILGLYSNWFYKNGSYSAQIICTIVIAMAAIFSLESSIKSGYSRFKTLFLSKL